MDNLQPSDIPDGRGGFMLRDDSALPRQSDAAPQPPLPTKGEDGMHPEEMTGDNAEQTQPDIMLQQEWQDDAQNTASKGDRNAPAMPNADAFDALPQNNAVITKSVHEPDALVSATNLDSDADNSQFSTPEAGRLDDEFNQESPSQAMNPSAGEDDENMTNDAGSTEDFADSSSDSAASNFSPPSDPDTTVFSENEPPSVAAQNDMTDDMADDTMANFDSPSSPKVSTVASPESTPESRIESSPDSPSTATGVDPSANALLGKISEMLGSLPKIEQHNATQHPENTGKHALATARVMFSPHLPAETTPVLSSTQRRGLQRLAHEEGLRQENIERIIAGSLGYLMPQATPDTIDKDWLSHFFDRARLAGDVETQAIWSRVLATKANNPNAQSRKTIAILGEMDRGAQNAFQKLCGYAWRLGYPTLMVYAIDENFFRLSGLSFAEMTDLVAHGLLTIERTAHYVRRKLPRNILVYYGSEPWKLTLPKDNDNVMSLGVASFTRAGIELFNCIDARENTAIRDVIAEHWRGLGFTLVSLAPTRKNNAST